MKMDLVLDEWGNKKSKGPGSLILKTLASLLSVFITENGLYTNWEKETYPFHYRDWKGRVSHHLPPETVQDILHGFLSSQRESSFSLFYQMDYKKTYIGKNFLPEGEDLYLKFYRLEEAPLKVRMRNVFRRSLARKGFNLYYPLKEKGVKSVVPLFYVRKKGQFIPDSAIYASYASEYNQTLDRLAEKKVEPETWLRLFRDLGDYVGDLMSKGILYGELYRNLIPIDRGDRWEFLLCDLDEMRSLSERRRERHFRYLEGLKKEIRFHNLSGHPQNTSALLNLFDQAFQRKWPI